MKYDLLIIVQAAADLKHALLLCEKHDGKKIHLCIIHVELIYEFVKQLPLKNIDIDFHPYVQFNIRNPFSYSIVKNKLSIIWKTYFKPNVYGKVYFFSRFYDWFSASLIGYLHRETGAEIIYYDHYDDASIKSINIDRKISIELIKHKFIALVVSYISNVEFVYQYKFKSLEFNYLKYNISKFSPNYKVYVNEKFQYKIKENSNKVILFYLSKNEIVMLTESAKKIVIKSLLSLKKLDYVLILKGHPRTGFPKELVRYFDSIVPNYLPSEFICYKNIFLTIGIVSAALCFPAQLDYKVFSLINALDFKHENNKMDYYNYLMQLSDNKILFVSKDWLKDL